MSVVDVGPDDAGVARAGLAWFRRFLLLHVAARCLLSVRLGYVAHDLEAGICWAVIAVAGSGFLPSGGWRLWATRLAAAGVLAEVAVTLPFTANHVFLELLCLGMLGLLDDRDVREGRLLLATLRWMVAVFFFYTGLQKLLYGYYFRGEMLAFLAGTEKRFALFFQQVIPDAELERLQSYNLRPEGPMRFRPRLNAGPYRVDALGFIVLSNVVYVFEMLAGGLLLLRRTRTAAALTSIVFVVLVELAARELTFGALMINLLLLYVPGAWTRRMFPVFAAGYAYLVAASFGALPMFWYSPA